MPGQDLHRGVIQRAPNIEAHILVAKAAPFEAAGFGLGPRSRAEGSGQTRVPRHLLLEVDDDPAERGLDGLRRDW